MSNGFGFIGDFSGSTGVVTVDGAGSTWTNSADLNVGAAGNGTLTIRNGGAVSNGYGFIGSDSGSTGAATVDGAGSTWTNSADLYVGYSGSGTLTIRNGGTVSNGFGFIGYDSGSTGAATVDGAGSTWTNQRRSPCRPFRHRHADHPQRRQRLGSDHVHCHAGRLRPAR